MVMTRSTAIGSIVTGSIMLGFAIIAIICGAISASKLSGRAAANAGLWSLCFVVPGVLSILAGVKKNSLVMAFALFFNIIAVIVSSVASVILIIIVILMNEVRSSGDYSCSDVGDQCYCTSTSIYSDYNSVRWNMKCDDIDTVYSVFVAVLVVYIILTIVTFTASIFGCMGTCCAPRDPVVVMTTGVPVHNAGAVVVTSNQSSIQQGYAHGYVAQPMPSQAPGYGYGAQPPPVYATHENKVALAN
ncbi:uncharacterized protein LOC124450627 isoform X1 [Xenia sp. Carnegie-2017]|uniref:uncharacterized protein LOC124450627 isoform X1 n=1 Tax=Xenia sp. Carnegie-2017 TaxID=2897299 RepID=UPI001F039397|nr:uncharacterized protein LOC124450627 isoform X1 [Xenia sp. Carnegie-2017]